MEQIKKSSLEEKFNLKANDPCFICEKPDHIYYISYDVLFNKINYSLYSQINNYILDIRLENDIWKVNQGTMRTSHLIYKWFDNLKIDKSNAKEIYRKWKQFQLIE